MAIIWQYKVGNNANIANLYVCEKPEFPMKVIYFLLDNLRRCSIELLLPESCGKVMFSLACSYQSENHLDQAWYKQMKSKKNPKEARKGYSQNLKSRMQNVVYDGKKLDRKHLELNFFVKSFTDKEFTVKWHKNDNLAIKTATSLYQSGNFKADQLNESWNQNGRYTSFLLKIIDLSTSHRLLWFDEHPVMQRKRVKDQKTIRHKKKILHCLRLILTWQ